MKTKISILLLSFLAALFAQNEKTQWKYEIAEIENRLLQNEEQNIHKLYQRFFQVENQELCEKILILLVDIVRRGENKQLAADTIVNIARMDLANVAKHFVSSLIKDKNTQVQAIAKHTLLEIDLYVEKSRTKVQGDLDAFFKYNRTGLSPPWEIRIANLQPYNVYGIKVVLHVPFALQFVSYLADDFDRKNRTLIWHFDKIEEGKTVAIPLMWSRQYYRFFNTLINFRVEVFSENTLICRNYLTSPIRCLICSGFPIATTYDIEDPLKIGEEGVNVVTIHNHSLSALTGIRLVYTLSEHLEFIAAEPKNYQQAKNTITFMKISLLSPDEKLSYKIKYRAISVGSAVGTAKLTSDSYTKVYSSFTDYEVTSVYDPKTPQNKEKHQPNSYTKMKQNEVIWIFPKKISFFLKDVTKTNDDTIKLILEFANKHHENYPKLTTAFIDLLKKRPHSPNTNGIIYFLGNVKAPVTSLLVDLYPSMSKVNKISILESLRQIGKENEVVMRLIHKLLYDKEEYIQWQAIEFISRVASPKYPFLRKSLLRLLDHKSIDIQISVVKAIDKMDFVDQQIATKFMKKIHLYTNSEDDDSKRLVKMILLTFVNKKISSVVPELLKLNFKSTDRKKLLVKALNEITGKDYTSKFLTPEEQEKTTWDDSLEEFDDTWDEW
ncbi:hypothetical protein [Candidatus Uabimicrobium sp. HlEnr_7]|uniref:hypothetical protein n=1 Tax=Candidatus Uabimicrobium helgolandensis TaxID=3095367 RepID=UPI00355781AB